MVDRAAALLVLVALTVGACSDDRPATRVLVVEREMTEQACWATVMGMPPGHGWGADWTDGVCRITAEPGRPAP